VTGAFVQRVELHRLRGNALPKVAITGQRHDDVPITIWRERIEQVDHAVFQPAGIEMMDDVYDQRLLHSCATRSSPRWIAASLSWMNAVSAATASAGESS
jgi:hypothetical protein